MNKYVLAVLVCIGIFAAYVFIGAALGWRSGGGIIPMMILIGAMGFAWKVIAGNKK